MHVVSTSTLEEEGTLNTSGRASFLQIGTVGQAGSLQLHGVWDTERQFVKLETWETDLYTRGVKKSFGSTGFRIGISLPDCGSTSSRVFLDFIGIITNMLLNSGHSNEQSSHVATSYSLAHFVTTRSGTGGCHGSYMRYWGVTSTCNKIT